MENKRLLTVKLPDEAKITTAIYEDAALTLKFDTAEGVSTVRIADYHDQDCCEHVYADWPTVQPYEAQLDKKTIKEIEIYGVADMGFVLCFNQDYGRSEKVFVPCYNEQNGYYSSNLELQINHDGVVSKVDISNYVESNID